MQKDWKKQFFEGNFSSAGSDTVNVFSFVKEDNEGHGGGAGSGRACLSECFVSNSDHRCAPKKKWEQGQQIRYFLRRISLSEHFPFREFSQPAVVCGQ